MAWATAYLVCSVVGALFVVNAYCPIRQPTLGVVSFFAAWPTSELPLWHIGWQAAATAGFAAAGAFDRWPGWVGAAVTACGWAGLAELARRSARAGAVLDRALADVVLRAPAGEDLPQTGRDTMWRLPRLLYPFPRPARSMRVWRHLDYAGDGSRRHRLDVIVRRQDPPVSGAPVLVYVHGGAWVMGDKREQGLPMLHELARRGWVTVSVNYGLGPRTRWPGHVVDCKRALAWVKANIADYGGDPGFVAVSGGSAGGHLAALLALTPADPVWQPGFEGADTSVDACVAFYGVYDFTGGGEDPRADRALTDLLERRVFPATRRADPDAYRQASPVHRVRGDAPPFFVIHGANDTLVPVAEARRFVDTFRAVATSPVCYAELPGAQHAFDVLPSVRGAHTVAAVVRFLQAVRLGAVRDQTAAVDGAGGSDRAAGADMAIPGDGAVHVDGTGAGDAG